MSDWIPDKVDGYEIHPDIDNEPTRRLIWGPFHGNPESPAIVAKVFGRTAEDCAYHAEKIVDALNEDTSEVDGE